MRGNQTPSDVGAALRAALASGRPIRLHLRDGEVVVARLLELGDSELRYAPLQSSRPERYAICDSTGFALARAQLLRAQLLAEPKPRARA